MHFFHFDPRQAVEPVFIDGKLVLSAFGPHLDRLLSASLPEPGLPMLISCEGLPVSKLNAFSTFLRSDGVSLNSASHYARDLQVFARYLKDLYGKSLLEASNADIGGYRRLRLEGPQQLRLAGSSWKRTSAALSRFYQWAASDDVALIKVAPRTRFRRDGAVAEDTIKMVPLEDYVLFREHGLLAKSHIDDVRLRRSPLRDAAFAELLVTTGLRLEEAASLLAGEVPTMDASVLGGPRSTMLDLPSTITKGRKPRSVPFPKRVVSRFIEPYIREERTRLADRWRRAGGAQSMREPLIGWRLDGAHLAILGEESPRSIARLQINERRNLVLLPAAGASLEYAEPAALWLSQGGGAMTTAAWQSIFRRASEATSRKTDHEISITPHTLRHTFAVYWLTHLIKAEVARLGQQARADRTEEVYMKVVSDPLRRIQKWLGHASSLTTQKYLAYVDEAFEILEDAAEALDGRLEAGSV